MDSVKFSHHLLIHSCFIIYVTELLQIVQTFGKKRKMWLQALYSSYLADITQVDNEYLKTIDYPKSFHVVDNSRPGRIDGSELSKKIRPLLWSRVNIVTSHAEGPGSNPGRVNYLIEVFPGVSPQP